MAIRSRERGGGRRRRRRIPDSGKARKAPGAERAAITLRYDNACPDDAHGQEGVGGGEGKRISRVALSAVLRAGYPFYTGREWTGE